MLASLFVRTVFYCCLVIHDLLIGDVGLMDLGVHIASPIPFAAIQESDIEPAIIVCGLVSVLIENPDLIRLRLLKSQIGEMQAPRIGEDELCDQHLFCWVSWLKAI